MVHHFSSKASFRLWAVIITVLILIPPAYAAPIHGASSSYKAAGLTAAKPKTLKAKVRYIDKNLWATVNKAYKGKSRNPLKGYENNETCCTDGEFIYMAIGGIDKKKKSRILKLRAEDFSFVSLSKKLDIGHANGMCYDPENKRLVVAYGNGYEGRAKKGKTYRYICTVDTATLSKVKKHKIKIRLRNRLQIRQFNGIAYFPKKKQYILKARRGGDRAVWLDKNFKVIKYTTMPRVHNNLFTQGTCEYKGKFYMAQSGKDYQNKNYVCVHTRYGRALKDYRIPVKGELESVFFVGDKMYGTSYVMNKKNTIYCFEIII